jgi:hypothetical protein
MRHRFLGVAIATALTAAIAAPVLALGTLDQDFPPPATLTGAGLVYWNQGEGLTFVAGRTGLLDTVAVYIQVSSISSGTVTDPVLEVHATDPNGPVLAATTIPASLIPSFSGSDLTGMDTPVLATFGAPTPVVAGQAYAITMPATTNTNAFDWAFDNVVPGGPAWYRQGSNPWLRENPGFLFFQTYVTSPTLTPASGPKKGGTAVTVLFAPGSFSASTIVTICGSSVHPSSVGADGSSVTFSTPRCTKVGPTPVTTTPATPGIPDFTYTRK